MKAPEIRSPAEGQAEGFPAPKAGPEAERTHLERIVAPVPAPYYLGWPLLAAALLVLSIPVQALSEKSFAYFDFFLIISAIVALEGSVISWAHRKTASLEGALINIINLPEEETVRSFRKEKAEIFHDLRMVIFAAAFIAFVHVTGIDYHATSFSSSISEALFNLEYYMAVYLEGAGLYVMLMTARAVHRIGKQPLKVHALASDLQAIGSLYSKFTICAASVYIAWGFFHMIVPPRFSSLQMIAWFLSFAFLLIGYFVLPQYSLHRMMKSAKEEKMEILSSQLKAALDESLEVPSKENERYLKDMLSIQGQLDQISEWPFGLYEILYIALIILIPLAIIWLEITLGIIK